MAERTQDPICPTKLGKDFIDPGTNSSTRCTPPVPTGSAQPKSKLCNILYAVDFVKTHQADCQPIAEALDVPVENILGLAAHESQWGNGRIASTYNNFFSLHAPAPHQIRSELTLGKPPARVAVFSSFSQSAQSFQAQWGGYVKGKKEPGDFADALIDAGFNTNDSSTGGDSNFRSGLVRDIRNTKTRLGCSSP